MKLEDYEKNWDKSMHEIEEDFRKKTEKQYLSKKMVDKFEDGVKVQSSKMRDNYRVEDFLGAGAFGEVRKCIFK